MKKFTLLFLIALSYNQLHAQLFGRHYNPGHFYTTNGKKISGLISFNKFSDYFFYKESDKADNQKYKAADVKALVVIETVKNEALGELIKSKPKGPQTVTDSFVVSSIEKPGRNLYFAKVICDLSSYKLYHKLLPPVGGAPTMNVGVAPNMGSRGSQPAFHNTYTWSAGRSYPGAYQTYYEKGGVTYQLTKSNFKAILTEAFSDRPNVVSMLNDIKFKEIDDVIEAYISAKAIPNN